MSSLKLDMAKHPIKTSYQIETGIVYLVVVDVKLVSVVALPGSTKQVGEENVAKHIFYI